MARIETVLDAAALLANLHSVERGLGRERTTRWAARTIDLDLIAYGDMVHPDLDTYHSWRDMPLDQQRARAPDGLILPHPRLQDRAFVLGPLCDVAPDWRHPVLGQTAQAMFDALPEADKASLTRLPPQLDAQDHRPGHKSRK